MSKQVKVSVLKGKVDAKKYVAEHGYPEVGQFVEQKDLQKFYKQLDDTQLSDWLTLEGLIYNPSDNEPINRMRMAMAILYKHFPKETASKKKSKYADYTTEYLIQLAVDECVPVECTDDMRIMRMRVIMALRAAGKID